MPALVAELKAEVRTEVVMALLEPLFIALGDAVDPHSLQRTTDAVDALLEALKPEAEAEAMEDDASGDEEESAPRLQATLPLPLLAERLFGLASAKRTRETNRTHLYALQQRVEALAAASGGAPAVAAPAVGKALAAPRADPEQVDALRRLIGSKAGAKAAAKAGAKAGGKAVREAEPGSGAPAAATSPPLAASRPKKKKRSAVAEAAAEAEAEAAEAAEAEAEAAAAKRPKRPKSAGKAAKAAAEAAEAEEAPPAAKAATTTRAGARKRKA